MTYTREQYLWVILRLLLAFIFLWAFIDKLWGLGFATAANRAWILGASPTAGFLKGSYGPFSGLYGALVSSSVVDWMFMMGLLLVGLGLLTGIMTTIASGGGILMLLLIYLSGWPPKQNPLIDQHIVYITILVGISLVKAGKWWGLGGWWQNLKVVQTHWWLE